MVVNKVVRIRRNAKLKLSSQKKCVTINGDGTASFYEEELDWRIDNLTSMIEPLIMAFLGLVVGGLLIAMYLPIFRMAKVVTGGR